MSYTVRKVLAFPFYAFGIVIGHAGLGLCWLASCIVPEDEVEAGE